MTSYNCEAAIRRSLTALAKQDYPKVELVIKDGGSTDGTLSVIDEFTRKIQADPAHAGWEIKLLKGRDEGLYAAMDEAIAASTGDYLIINNDVFCRPDSLSLLMEAALSREDVIGAHGDLVYVDYRGSGKYPVVRRFWKMQQGRIRGGWIPAHPTLLLARSVYEAAGPLNVGLDIAGDYDFMIRALDGREDKLVYVPELVVEMSYGGVSTSGAGSYLRSFRQSLTALKRNHLPGALGITLRRSLRLFKQFTTRP